MGAEEVLLSLLSELELPVQLALRLVCGPVLHLALDGAVARDEALAEARFGASHFAAPDVRAEEGRRRREGIRPPCGDLQRPQVLDDAHGVAAVVLGGFNRCRDEFGGLRRGFLEDMWRKGSLTKGVGVVCCVCSAGLVG